MTTQITEIESPEIDRHFNPRCQPPPHVKNFGSSVEQRIPADIRSPLDAAERIAGEARQKAEDIRNGLIERQTKIEALPARRDVFAVRLAKLQRRNIPAQRLACNAVVEEFLDNCRIE